MSADDFGSERWIIECGGTNYRWDVEFVREFQKTRSDCVIVYDQIECEVVWISQQLLIPTHIGHCYCTSDKNT